MNFEYDDAIQLSGDDDRVSFPHRWTMGPGYAHGGYLMSVALAAAASVSPQPDAVTMRPTSYDRVASGLQRSQRGL